MMFYHQRNQVCQLFFQLLWKTLLLQSTYVKQYFMSFQCFTLKLNHPVSIPGIYGNQHELSVKFSKTVLFELFPGVLRLGCYGSN